MEEKFNERCGEILRMALAVEANLDFFISNYFCHPQSYKTFILNDVIVDTLQISFGKKIEIFKKICKEEKIFGEREIKVIVDSIKFVSSIRNKVAHWEGFSENPDGEIKLQKRTSVKYKKDELKLTDKLVHDVDKRHLLAINGINEVYFKLSKLKRI